MRGMVLISLIGSPQQKRSIGCPGSYLGCSVSAMLESKTKVYMLSIRMCEPSSKGATLKNKRDHYFKTLWKGASTPRRIGTD